ncbi:MAG: ribonuclease P protein component [Candidatus Jidaibacter sp.]|nr:ribonuclease P protein component [Candidatus Jidaibacter sp.]
MVKVNTVKNAKVFSNVLKKGCKVVCPFFVLYYLEKIEISSGSSLGVIASKKIFKKATSRNKAKRLLREVARTSLTRENVDIVMVARNKILHSDFAQMQDEFSKSCISASKDCTLDL